MFESYEHNEQLLTPETEALIANGLDFLNKAREELQAGHAKFSVVSFWTAVEILMKVPLVHEHWTLACSGKRIERKKYLTGDFQSVTYDEACARLGDVLDKPLNKNIALLFNKVKNHRNRVVHFYHNELSDGDQQQVLTEQANAWFALNHLMREDWSSLFGSQLRRKLASDETGMLRSNEFYAAAKFRHESVQERIVNAKAAGRRIEACSVCHQLSVIPEQPLHDMPLYEHLCYVCHYSEFYVEVSCPDCQSKVVMLPDGDDFYCSSCGLEKGRFEVISLAEKTKHNMSDFVFAGCSYCKSIEGICEYGDAYLCTVCFTVHHSLETCDNCQQQSSSIPDDSAVFGCDFCEGHHDVWEGN